jgi:hypothetical protein
MQHCRGIQVRVANPVMPHFRSISLQIILLQSTAIIEYRLIDQANLRTSLACLVARKEQIAHKT